MKFSTKLSLTISGIGIFSLLFLSLLIYKSNLDELIESQFNFTKSISKELSNNIDRILIEKVKIAQTFISNDLIVQAVEISNSKYRNFSETLRNDTIKQLNTKWKSIEDENNKFILRYTDNKISDILKNQQQLLPKEYGEIFLTNKYGALVSSTAKLSTFAHGHKYWWLGSFNNGEGSIFFDDRGYDISVGGYVLGIVLPIKKDSEIIGIIKFNINVLGVLKELINGAENRLIGKFKLIRSSGLIVFERGKEPLSTKISDKTLNMIKYGKGESYIATSIDNHERIVGFSQIELTSEGNKLVLFGGRYSSISHLKGNSGEPWFILCYRDLDVVKEPIFESIKTLFVLGLPIILIILFIAQYFSKRITKPLLKLSEGAMRIGEGDNSFRINESGNDELSKLSKSFNLMSQKINDREQDLENNSVVLKLKNEELVEKNKIISKANNLKSEFLANMSHELRTPLNSIISLSELLSDYNETTNVKDSISYSKIINRNGKKLLFMINDILDLSKIEAGNIDLFLEKFSISKIISNIIENHIAIVDKKNIYIDNKINKEIFILSNEKRVLQILQNIINNAIKFTETGGVTITGYRELKHIIIQISDTGIGISKENLSYIFDTFKQVEGALNRNFDGTGLGLSIAKKSTALLGGTLEVRSILGKGTTFTLRLPVEIS